VFPPDPERRLPARIGPPNTHRYFEKFTNSFPQPVEKQNCHFEPKIQQKTRKRKAKHYSYSKDFACFCTSDLYRPPSCNIML